MYGVGEIVFDEDVVDLEGSAGLEFAFSRVSAAILGEEKYLGRSRFTFKERNEGRSLTEIFR